MNENLLQNLHIIATRPINFFPLSVDCHRLENYSFPSPLSQRYLLPDTSPLCKEDSFATVKMGWSEEGVAIDLNVHSRMEQVVLPEIHLGDGIELFFDTRDRKSAGANTRFCHHFGFLPKEYRGSNAYDGLIASELTRFRTEDKHEHCPPQDLLVESTMTRSSYHMLIFIPSHCLHGFDPNQFDRMGFTYRMNRSGKPQHFHIVSEEFSIDQHPAQWASLRLIS